MKIDYKKAARNTSFCPSCGDSKDSGGDAPLVCSDCMNNHHKEPLKSSQKTKEEWLMYYGQTMFQVNAKEYIKN